MTALDTAISRMGGVGKLAKAIGVSQPLISNWRKRGTTPKAEDCSAIERATGGLVTRRDLRPDDWHLIWPELAAQTSGTSGPVTEAPHG
ncbi:transcriptional regulator [Acidovorax sp. NCPPB 4044]|uniref:transcriptional regulator n=1 Tax=Acidovorax sp. NCPPB 4044 TaxID=2940490 RepID=UPI0023029F1E|nr:Cro/CI family transcriptional regulator [Acidovorax sp. NCPPB 4044]